MCPLFLEVEKGLTLAISYCSLFILLNAYDFSLSGKGLTFAVSYWTLFMFSINAYNLSLAAR